MSLQNNGEILNKLSEAIGQASLDERPAKLRAWEACLSSMSARSAMPLAAKWFFETRSVEGREPDENDSFWASHVTTEAAAELQSLLPRLVLLFSESRRCSLIGNSAAQWGYSALAIPLLPEPSGDLLSELMLEALFDEVGQLRDAYDFAPSRICYRALKRFPAILKVLFEHENPDVRMGHSMMRIAIDGDDVVSYWPALEDEEFNYVNTEKLAATCELLELRHVLPLQLATFFAVLACATSDGSEDWGGQNGAFFFDEGNLPYVLSRLEEDP